MSDRETWLLRVELPAGLSNPGRFVARILKWLLRTWGVKCVALRESAELEKLRKIINGLAARVATQSEMLSARAEKKAKS